MQERSGSYWDASPSPSVFHLHHLNNCVCLHTVVLLYSSLQMTKGDLCFSVMTLTEITAVCALEWKGLKGKPANPPPRILYLLDDLT